MLFYLSSECLLKLGLALFQPVEPGQVYEDAAGEQAPEIEVDVGVVFNASVTKEDQTLV